MVTETITNYKIDNHNVFLISSETGKGRCAINGPYHNYSYYWGAMGCPLEEFLCNINSEYFAKNMIGYQKMYEIDIKATFATLRKYIKDELGLPFYNHQVFQKHMREVLRNFQQSCEELNSDTYFVETFHCNFIQRLDFYLVDNYDRETVRKNFEGISEQWYFIQNKPSINYKWLMSFHNKLKKELKKGAK